jgi:hypothetical protein
MGVCSFDDQPRTQADEAESLTSAGKKRSPEERPEIRHLFALSRSFFIGIGGPQAHGDSLWSRLCHARI